MSVTIRTARMYSKIFIFVCLFSVSVSGKKERVVGGVIADRTDFPYQALLKRITNDKIICGGAIIGHLFVLTTAHCVDDRINSHANIKVIVGNSNSASLSGNTFIPDRIYIHPAYTGELNDYTTLENDIAILRLSNYIEYNEFQNKIKLPTKDVFQNDIGIVSGWGTTTFPWITMPLLLRKNWMTIHTYMHCKSIYSGIQDDQFCAFQKLGVGPCIGDGGAPLVNVGRLIGLASLSFQCAAGVPDVYTSVFAHLDFIKYITNEYIEE